MTEQGFNQLSRRRFLQVVAAGATAAAIGSIHSELNPKQAAAMIARQQAGILRVAWGTPATFDPIVASADAEIALFNAVYDYLVDTDQASQLVPRLAESWEVNDAGTVWTINLREGVTFHDGSPLTVEDVLFSINYQREGGGVVSGLLAAVEDISTEGNSISFTLNAPNPDFMYVLSDNRIIILQDGASNIGEAFNGTGPFVLTEYIPGDRAILSANANYWGDVPSIETLEFIYFDDPQAAISALQGGIVDVALRMDNPTFFSLAGEVNFNAVDIPTSGHDLARLRADRAPGDNPLVQQAFKLATDRQAIYERIQLGFGSVGKDSPVGPVFGQYHDNDLQPPTRDPQGARALLEEAGYPDGLDLTFYVPNSGDRPALAQALAAQWEEAGIRVEIELQDEATYYADSGWLEVDLGITGWGARPTAQLFLDQYVKSGQPYNEAHYNDPEVDALIERAGVSTIEQERVAIYHEIQRILLERGPFIISYFFAQFMVHDAAVSGINVAPFAGRTNFGSASF